LEATVEQGVVTERPAAGAVPVAALPYSLEAQAGWPIELKFAVAAVVATAVAGLLSFATTVWIYLQPQLFRTVGTYRSFWSDQFAFGLMQTLVSAVALAGGVAFYSRRTVCRPLLMGASAALVLLDLLTNLYYLFIRQSAPTQQTTPDRVVMAVWQSGSLLANVVAPLLVLLVMTRPNVKARFRTGGV
jgi:hypothetical protein